MFPKAIQRKNRFEGSDDAEALGGWIFVQSHTAGKEWQCTEARRWDDQTEVSWLGLGNDGVAWASTFLSPLLHFSKVCLFPQSPKAAEVLIEQNGYVEGVLVPFWLGNPHSDISWFMVSGDS